LRLGMGLTVRFYFGLRFRVKITVESEGQGEWGIKIPGDWNVEGWKIAHPIAVTSYFEITNLLPADLTWYKNFLIVFAFPQITIIDYST
jgi:hypothetical protein